MKTAYELALERLESQGIERPREDGLPESIQRRIAEEKSKAEAKLAELEILHQGALAKFANPVEQQQAEAEYRRERREIEERRDRRIDTIRQES